MPVLDVNREKLMLNGRFENLVRRLVDIGIFPVFQCNEGIRRTGCVHDVGPQTCNALVCRVELELKAVQPAFRFGTDHFNRLIFDFAIHFRWLLDGL